jgi:hypothetical protein
MLLGLSITLLELCHNLEGRSEGFIYDGNFLVQATGLIFARKAGACLS